MRSMELLPAPFAPMSRVRLQTKNKYTRACTDQTHTRMQHAHSPSALDMHPWVCACMPAPWSPTPCSGPARGREGCRTFRVEPSCSHRGARRVDASRSGSPSCLFAPPGCQPRRHRPRNQSPRAFLCVPVRSCISDTRSTSASHQHSRPHASLARGMVRMQPRCMVASARLSPAPDLRCLEPMCLSVFFHLARTKIITTRMLYAFYSGTVIRVMI